MDGEYKSARDILMELLPELEKRKELGAASVFKWTAIAGEELAAKSRVVDIKNGRLIVELDRPIYNQLLIMNKRVILARIAKFYPHLNIKDIKTTISFEPQ